MARKSSSSKRWLSEHFTDKYVKEAKVAGYRSRAVFKLKEINERDRLFKPGMKIVDLGAAPGGWSQYAAPLIKPHGKIVAVDLLPMDPIPGVEFIQGDFSDEAIVAQLGDTPVDMVMSDMAPNMSGNESVDIPRTTYLAELALEFALRVLPNEGIFLIKVFQGEGVDALLAEIKSNFLKVAIRKPKASRDRSREIYILARTRRSVVKNS